MNGAKGTDNPAFSSDANVGDCVTETKSTKIVRVPSSAIDDMSLGTGLSIKDGDDGKIYVCERSDESKGKKKKNYYEKVKLEKQVSHDRVNLE